VQRGDESVEQPLPRADIDPASDLASDLTQVRDLLEAEFFVQGDGSGFGKAAPPITQCAPGARNLSSSGVQG